MGRLSFKVKKISDVSESDRKTMFNLYRVYYDLADDGDFDRDFLKKDHVIILSDKKDKSIQGFSTQLIVNHHIDGEDHLAIFSGDTIVDKKYWGDPALSLGFLWYLLGLSYKRPWKKVYWHLISKGYKTYMLLARNFEHYPCYYKDTPAFDCKMMQSFADEFYPNNYYPDLDLLKFDTAHEKLKDGVTPITDELRAKFPEIAFFEKKNPHWQSGDELVCIGHFYFLLPIVYVKKICVKKIKKLLRFS